MTIQVTRYDAGQRALVAALLAQGDFGLPVDTEVGYWHRLLTRPDDCSEAIFWARDAAGGFGVAWAGRRPLMDGNARGVTYLLPRGEDARALGKALGRAVGEELAARGFTREIVLVPQEQVSLCELLEARGFEPFRKLHGMGWTSDGSPVPAEPVPGIALRLYDGRDPALAEPVADLWRRAFAGDSFLAPMTAAEVERALRGEAGWMMLAVEEASGRLAGASEAGAGAMFVGIAVARAHWGRGVAELLAAASMQEFLRRGFTSLFSHVDVSNAASLSLHRRMGWRRLDDWTVYRSQPLASGTARQASREAVLNS